MIGKYSCEVAKLRSCEVEVGEGRRASNCLASFRNLVTSKLPNCSKGFSLLELMIAMFIIIILLSIAVPTYERSVRNAREIVLKENLFQMRRAIDQYAGDKGKLPASVGDLVEAKYLREKPIDPISETTEWEEIMGEDPNSADGEQGLVNVKTMAQGQDVNGVSYAEY